MKTLALSLAAFFVFLISTVVPCFAQPMVWHQGISQTNINVRGNPVVVGQRTINAPSSGTVVVRFDGMCYSSVGDRIVLAASNTADWTPNDGNVGVEAVSTDLNINPFSHTRVYSVGAGSHTYYAVAQNYVETAGTGYASIYASLTVEFFPTVTGGAFVSHQGISQTGINIRGNPVVVGQRTINAPSSGTVVVRFDGDCISSVGDRIVLAASDTADWTPNDGNVTVRAASSDVDANSFSHTRVYSVGAGSHTYYAVAQNYVETAGTGYASIYASLTVEFFPTVTGGAFVSHQGISQTNINVRGNPVVVGQRTISAPSSGTVVVRFDGGCISSAGDRIVLAASNTADWGINDGNVSVEVVSSDVNRKSFSHTRAYSVGAGSHTYYAVAQNYVATAGTGIASIYASLTVEFLPAGTILSDFDRDGDPDILWRNQATGEIALWYMNGASPVAPQGIATVPDGNWKIVGVGDFDRDGDPDILWRHQGTGEIALWYMNGASPVSPQGIATVPDTNWSIVGVGDFDRDGDPDILWRHQGTGEIALWYMNGVNPVSPQGIATVPDGNWKIVGVGDFDRDGDPDILWWNQSTGEVALWYMNGASPVSPQGIATVPTNWRIMGVADFNRDGNPDILWRHQTTGEIALWYMNGPNLISPQGIATVPDLNWEIAAP